MIWMLLTLMTGSRWRRPNSQAKLSKSLTTASGSNSSTMRKYSRTFWGHPETAPERLRASVCQRRTSFSL